MATIVYGPLVCDAVGGIRDVVFARSKQGPTCRSKPTRTNADTSAEIRCRNALTAVTKQWGTLTKSQQAAWSAAGQAHPEPNRLDKYYGLSGFNLFTKLNLNRVFAGQTIQNDPPTTWSWAPIAKPLVQATQAPTATTALTAAWNQFTELASQIVLEATPATPFGQSPQRHQLRYITTFAPGTTLPQSVETPWEAVYGVLPFNTPYQILWRFTPYDQDTGVPGTTAEYVTSIGGPANTDPPAGGGSIGTATPLTESTNYYFDDGHGHDGWYSLPYTTGVTYTVTYTANNTGGNPTLTITNPTSGATATYTFAQYDTLTYTPLAGDLVAFTLTSPGPITAWTLIFNPTQTPARAVFACGTSGAVDAITVLLENGQIWQSPTPTQPAGPDTCVIDRNGNVWMTELLANQVAVMQPDGTIVEYPTPTAGTNPSVIIVGNDGNIWFLETATSAIARCTPTGAITEFPTPTPDSDPQDLCIGSDNNYWFTENATAQLAKCTPTGTITEYPLAAGAAPSLILSGPDGAIWATDGGLFQIIRCTTDGTITTYTVPTPGAGFIGFCVGPDGNMWYSDESNSIIGRVTPLGVITEFPTPTPASNPGPLAVAANGTLWFAEYNASQLANITTNGVITEWPTPAANDGPFFACATAAGDVWFTAEETNAFTKATPSNTFADYPTNPSTNAYTSPVAFNPPTPNPCDPCGCRPGPPGPAGPQGPTGPEGPPGPPGGEPPSVVQHYAAWNGFAASIVIDWPTATTAGNTLYASMVIGAAVTVTAPAGWLLLSTQTIATGESLQVYYATTASSRTNDTFSFSAGGTNAVVAALEIAGLLASPLDVTANNTGTATTAAAINPGTTPPTHYYTEIAIGVVGYFPSFGVGAIGIGSGYTAEAGAADGSGDLTIVLAIKILSTTGPQTFVGTGGTGPYTWAAFLATFV